MHKKLKSVKEKVAPRDPALPSVDSDDLQLSDDVRREVIEEVVEEVAVPIKDEKDEDEEDEEQPIPSALNQEVKAEIRESVQGEKPDEPDSQ